MYYVQTFGYYLTSTYYLLFRYYSKRRNICVGQTLLLLLLLKLRMGGKFHKQFTKKQKQQVTHLNNGEILHLANYSILLFIHDELLADRDANVCSQLHICWLLGITYRPLDGSTGQVLQFDSFISCAPLNITQALCTTHDLFYEYKSPVNDTFSAFLKFPTQVWVARF